MKKMLFLVDVLQSPAPILPSIVNLARPDNSFVYVIFLQRAHFQADLVYPLGTDLPALEADVEADQQQMKDDIRLIRDTFSAEGLSFKFSEEDVSLDEVLKNSAFSDLILADARTNMSDFLYAPLNISMKDLLTDAHCPVLLLREEGKPVERIVLSYDGSYSSIYAIKQFSY